MSDDPMRWVWRAVALGALVIGWIFILVENHFTVTAPVVIVCLAYLAVVATVANLWRVGAAAVAPEDATAEAWSRPLGERGELEKEKKTLLKAIKEAEFDHEMGKLSKVDADQLIGMYRTRAIEVIKELERMDHAEAENSPRVQIQREIAARLALEEEAKKAKGGKGKAKGKTRDDVEVSKPVDDKPAIDKPAIDKPVDDKLVENAAPAPAEDQPESKEASS